MNLFIDSPKDLSLAEASNISKITDANKCSSRSISPLSDTLRNNKRWCERFSSTTNFPYATYIRQLEFHTKRV